MRVSPVNWITGRKSCGPLSAGLTAVILSVGPPAVAPAQPPLRIGASVSQTGAYAAIGQNLLRGYQLSVKHTNQKGGLLGRKVELIVEDDQSQPERAAAIYEKLVTRDKVDALLGPYSSPITDAVADVAEKYRMPMIASGAAAASVFRKGRKFTFMLLSPGEVYLEGLIDMAARRKLKTLAVVHEDTVFPIGIAHGTTELARKRGLQVVFVEAYPRQASDFSRMLGRLKATNPDVIGAATYLEDSVAITREMKRLDINPKMYAVTVGGDLPKFYETLGRTAEYVYGATQWEPELVTLRRGGGLIPVARRYPGAREFVEAHKTEFPGADLSYHTAEAYGGCQVFVEAVKRAGSLDADRLRDVILKMDFNTVFGGFRVDRTGFQVAHTMLMFQWQDGKKVIVWPDELASSKPRFPTPPWSQRP